MHRLITWAHDQLIAPTTQPSVPADQQLAAMAKVEEPSEPLAPVPPVAAPSGLESKIENLIETMQTLISLQMSPAAPSVQRTPDSTPKNPKLQTAHQSTENTDAAQPTRRYRSKEENADLVERAIAAIMDWNNKPGRAHDEKWAISINALKTLGVNQRQAVKALEEHAQAVQQHHAQHQMDGEKHNLRHRRKRLITDVISL